MKTMVPQTEQGCFHVLKFNGSHNIVIISNKVKKKN